MEERGTEKTPSFQLPELTDLELTVLVCLIVEQHAIVRAPAHLIDSVQNEFVEISNSTFDLQSVNVNCSESGSIDEFSEAIFGEGISRIKSQSSETETQGSNGANQTCPNLVIVKNLNLASRDVQVMALELIRNNRILTSSGVHTTLKPFVIIALIPDDAPGPPYLTLHLNDAIFISHTIPPNSTFSNIHSHSNSDSPTTPSPITPTSSSPSKLSKQTSSYQQATAPKISKTQLEHLKTESSLVKSTAEMRRYIHNVPTFLRLHRAVGGGVSAMSTRHLNSLVRTLAPLHQQTYVTPSLIGLAAHKIYPHRVVLTAPEDERSMQWGSDLDAVREALEGLTVERIVQEVLDRVDAPL